MRATPLHVLLLLAAGCNGFRAGPGPAPAPSPPTALSRHDWRHIWYPAMPVPGRKGGTEWLSAVVGSGFGGRRLLRLDISWSGLLDQRPRPEELAVRLHRADGTIAEPDDEEPPAWRGWSIVYWFPWGRNVLEEAWFEIHASGRTYWIEVPYGFTRNPNDPLAPPALDGGEPSLAPAMKSLGDNDDIVSWRYVEYDLGAIQSGWRLSLKQANPFDAKCEVILYRDDTRVGKSI